MPTARGDAATADAAGAGASAPTNQGEPKASPPEIADLGAMCAAVEKDYIDGTLSDYFAGFTAASPWGTKVRSVADESMTPGRALLAAALARGLVQPGGHASPALDPACARLFEVLDDLE